MTGVPLFRTLPGLPVLILVLFTSPLFGQAKDPFFSNISFDRWLSGKGESHMRWSARLGPPRLSNYQRLIAPVYLVVDGGEIAKRRGQGHLYVLVEVRDGKGAAWQNHQDYDLVKADEAVKSKSVEFGELIFVTPGDYTVWTALYVDATGEHSVLKRQLHVSALKNDPFPDAWRGLPAVEFVPESKPPESWYLPSLEGRLNLTVTTHEPVQTELLVNLTPSGRLAASTRAQSRALEVLIPAAKVISQINWGRTPFGLTFLDLPKQRVIYQQDDAQRIDWSRAGDSLNEVKAGTIDAKALEHRHLSADFFVGEVRWLVTKARGKGTPVLIIMSGAIHFDDSQELVPIRNDGSINPKIFYIRYQPIRELILGRGGGTTRPAMRTGDPIPDQLEPLLRPLEPRLFEVSTQPEVRRALATILSEISKL